MTDHDKMIHELCTLTTRNDAGQHFTEISKWYQELEEAGLITIDRPVHSTTGISYSQEYWSLEITEEGQEEVDHFVNMNPELFVG